MSFETDIRSTCIAGGPLRAEATEHSDCPVLVVEASQVPATRRSELGELPALCACECLGCQRVWWDMGRPMRKGRAIVTAAGKVLG